MSFAWITFLAVTLIANLLLISVEFFGIAGSPSHTANASEHTDVKGPERFERFSGMFMIQAILVAATIGLIAYYIYFARTGETSYTAALWGLGMLILAFPLYQVSHMGGRRPNAPADSASAKFVSYLAIPVTILIALVGTMDRPSPNFELNHLAFEVASLDEVVLARNHLRKHGVAIDFEGRRRAGVQIAVEFRDPDGHRLEIYWGLDRVGTDGYIRPANEWKGAKTLRDAIADPVRGQDTTLRDSSILDDVTPTADARASGGKSRFD